MFKSGDVVIHKYYPYTPAIILNAKKHGIYVIGLTHPKVSWVISSQEYEMITKIYLTKLEKLIYGINETNS